MQHNIKIVFAHALLLMALYSMHHNKKLSWDILFDKLFKEDIIGLVTAGVISEENGNPIVKPISPEIITSSVQSFF